MGKIEGNWNKNCFIFTQSSNHDMEVAFNSIGWVVIPNELNLGI
ncbi:hypothetical protein DE171_005667 [Clostridium beijerinckii]|nr:hypothetical protein [Clostridium beijerinckii]